MCKWTPARPHLARSPGRPLDPEVDRAILAAAGEIFVRDGFQNMTLPGVAAAAGVAKTTVYRRYANTVELVLATINHLNTDVPAPDTGSARDDLATVLDFARLRFDPSVTGTLLTEEREHPELLDVGAPPDDRACHRPLPARLARRHRAGRAALGPRCRRVRPTPCSAASSSAIWNTDGPAPAGPRGLSRRCGRHSQHQHPPGGSAPERSEDPACAPGLTRPLSCRRAPQLRRHRPARPAVPAPDRAVPAGRAARVRVRLDLRLPRALAGVHGDDGARRRGDRTDQAGAHGHQPGHA